MRDERRRKDDEKASSEEQAPQSYLDKMRPCNLAEYQSGSFVDGLQYVNGHEHPPQDLPPVDEPSGEREIAPNLGPLFGDGDPLSSNKTDTRSKEQLSAQERPNRG